MKPKLSNVISALGVFLFTLPGSLLADWGALNMPRGVTEVSRNVYDLHMMVFWVCCVLAAIVFGVMFYSILMHRKSRGVKAATFHESTLVEIIWTTLPFFVLIAVAIPAAKEIIAMEDTSNAELTVKVTGSQWKWHYEYLDSGVSFYSTLAKEHNEARRLGSGVDVAKMDNYLKEVDNPLVLPVGVKIRFLHTANDVIHAWWVPDLAVKKDAIPGFINENWAIIDKVGTYRGKCAELCGRDHGFMPIVVQVVSPEEFADWLGAQKDAQAAEVQSSDVQSLSYSNVSTSAKITEIALN